MPESNGQASKRRIPLHASVRTTLRVAREIEADREPQELPRVFRSHQDSVRCRRATEIDEAFELQDQLTEVF